MADECGDPPPSDELLPYPVSPLQHPLSGKSRDNPSKADKSTGGGLQSPPQADSNPGSGLKRLRKSASVLPSSPSVFSKLSMAFEDFLQLSILVRMLLEEARESGTAETLSWCIVVCG